MLRKKHVIMICIFVIAFILCMEHTIYAQENKRDLTRSKVWVTFSEQGLPHGSRNVNLGEGFVYPGFYGGGKNDCTGFPEMSVMAYRGDQQVYLKLSRSLDGDPAITFDQSATIIRNYNFINKNNLPPKEQYAEEILKAEFTVNDPAADAILPRIKIKTRTLGWSLPKYDDFLITEYTITSIEPSETLNNLNFTFKAIVTPASGGGSTGNIDKNFRHDIENVWDPKRFTFLFYDAGMYFEEMGGEVFQKYSPGDVTGDVGDPGNIFEANSIDFQLYSPQAVAWGYVDVTPNELDKQGSPDAPEGSVDWQIASGSGADRAIAPTSENFEIDTWNSSFHNIPRPSTKPVRLLKFPQKRMNWLEAYEQDPSLDSDGNLVERVPTVISVVGPYNLDPDESISFKRIVVFGELDRSISMRGGLKATKQLDMDFVTDKEGGEGEKEEHAAIKALRENWDNAVKLVNNNYMPEEFPPPAVGLPPGVADVIGEPSLGSAMKAEALEEAVGDVSIGVRLTFDAVPSDYTDPLTGENDFEGYIIKQSDVGVEGPWSAIDTLKANDVNIVDGRVQTVVPTQPGLPLLFGVTTYDSDGNESGMTSYTLHPIQAKALPPADHDMAKVRVVPNPFKQTSFYPNPEETKRLNFVNVPGICTIRIYNLAGDHIVTIEHDDGLGEEAWGSTIKNNYMLTKFGSNVMPGLYFYHITSHVPGHEGEEATGKFVIIK